MFSWNNLVIAARGAQIDAPSLRGITLAQWALESGWGSSRLATEHGNFAGLKWRPEMQGIATPVSYQAHDGTDTYCAFESEIAFIKGYWRFINRSPYKGWQAKAHDPEGYIRFLEACGYAAKTDPAKGPGYAEKVIALLPEIESLLAADGVAHDEGDRPDRPDLEPAVDHSVLTRPNFTTVGEVQHKFRGSRPKGLEGAIVHYDAGRSRPRAGADASSGARSTLDSAVGNGFAYATIARDGRILLPGNMDWKQWGYHAGQSVCPVTGRSGVSQYYVGFEINTPGLLYPTADPDVFVPWFDATSQIVMVNGKQVRKVVLDAKGRASVGNANAEIYRKAEVRTIAKQEGNIRPGTYAPYTAQQYDSLINVLLWLKAQYPTSFRLDYVFGHDEVSPGRKVDPGGALGLPVDGVPGPAMTMAAFRGELLRAWAAVHG